MTTKAGARAELLKTARVEATGETFDEWLQREIAAAPPLTDEQISKIRWLLLEGALDHERPCARHTHLE